MRETLRISCRFSRACSAAQCTVHQYARTLSASSWSGRRGRHRRSAQSVADGNDTVMTASLSYWRRDEGQAEGFDEACSGSYVQLFAFELFHFRGHVRRAPVAEFSV